MEGIKKSKLGVRHSHEYTSLLDGKKYLSRKLWVYLLCAVINSYGKNIRQLQYTITDFANGERYLRSRVYSPDSLEQPNDTTYDGATNYIDSRYYSNSIWCGPRILY